MGVNSRDGPPTGNPVFVRVEGPPFQLERYSIQVEFCDRSEAAKLKAGGYRSRSFRAVTNSAILARPSRVSVVFPLLPSDTTSAAVK